MKLLSHMFAEDIELLPDDLFTKLLLSSKTDPAKRNGKLQALFEAMAAGGDCGADSILHSSGGLFADAGTNRTFYGRRLFRVACLSAEVMK